MQAGHGRANAFGSIPSASGFYRALTDVPHERRTNRTPFTDGYMVPIAGLLALLFALMAGLTAQRALLGDPADAVLPVGFAIGALAALRFRQRYAAASADSDTVTDDDGPPDRRRRLGGTAPIGI